MQLIHCHIENFGKLSDVSMDFESSVNTILRENGWGKSTLAAFIKAMFYGLEGSRKKSTAENERRKYQPWQKGHFGGSISFSARGKSYTVTREFGKKEAEDTFSLTDNRTGLPSTDFSEQIGEELFRVDSESFRRTIMIRQEDAAYAGTTAGISAKIGNLTENTDDMNNFDTADARLRDVLNSMSPTRATGKISGMKNRLTELEVSLGEKPALEQELRGLEEKAREAGERQKALRKKQDGLLDTEKILLEIRERKGKSEVLRQLQKAEAVRKKTLEGERAFFGSRIPEASELREMRQEADGLQKARARYEQIAFTEEKQLQLENLQGIFQKGAPPEEDLQNAGDTLKKIENLQADEAVFRLSGSENQELEDLAEKFRVGIPSDEEIDEKIRASANVQTRRGSLSVLRQNAERENDLRKKQEAELEDLRNQFSAARRQQEKVRTSRAELAQQARERKRKRIWLSAAGILAGVLLAGAALFLILHGSRIPGFVSLFAGILLLAGSSFYSGREKAPDTSDLTSAEGLAGAEMKRLSGEISRKEASLAAQEKKYRETEEQLSGEEEKIRQEAQKCADFLAIFGLEYDPDHAENALYGLKADVRRLGKLQDKKRLEQEKDESREISRLVDTLRQILQPCYPAEYDAPLPELKKLVNRFEKDAEKYRTLSGEKETADQLQQEIRGHGDTLRQFFSGVRPEEADRNRDFSGVLAEIGTHLDRLNRAESEYTAANRERKAYEAEHPEVVLKDGRGEEIALPEETSREDPAEKDLAEPLEKQLSDVREAIENQQRNLSGYEQAAAAVCEKLDQLAETREEAEQLKKDIQSSSREYILVKRARELLTKAKENFTAKFMKPVTDGYGKYYRMMTGGDDARFRIDAEVNITRKEEGAYRGIETQSAGLQDLIGICMRMALVDVMYPEEKPFVLFDDPFVNLDAEKTAGAMKLLREIGKEYQVIYLTCHHSRT